MVNELFEDLEAETVLVGVLFLTFLLGFRLFLLFGLFLVFWHFGWGGFLRII